MQNSCQNTTDPISRSILPNLLNDRSANIRFCGMFNVVDLKDVAGTLSEILACTKHGNLIFKLLCLAWIVTSILCFMLDVRLLMPCTTELMLSVFSPRRLQRSSATKFYWDPESSRALQVCIWLFESVICMLTADNKIWPANWVLMHACVDNVTCLSGLSIAFPFLFGFTAPFDLELQCAEVCYDSFDTFCMLMIYNVLLDGLASNNLDKVLTFLNLLYVRLLLTLEMLHNCTNCALPYILNILVLLLA